MSWFDWFWPGKGSLIQHPQVYPSNIEHQLGTTSYDENKNGDLGIKILYDPLNQGLNINVE